MTIFVASNGKQLVNLENLTVITIHVTSQEVVDIIGQEGKNHIYLFSFTPSTELPPGVNLEDFAEAVLAQLFRFMVEAPWVHSQTILDSATKALQSDDNIARSLLDQLDGE